MKSLVLVSPTGCREKLPDEIQTFHKWSTWTICQQRIPSMGNHIDIQKAWLCYMQLIQEFFTWKNWREALSGGQDLILKLRRQKSGVWTKLAKGGDQEDWDNHLYFFLRDHNWGRNSWFWSASLADSSWLWLSIAPAVSITKPVTTKHCGFWLDLHLSYRCIPELSPLFLKVFAQIILLQRHCRYPLMNCWRGLAKKTHLVSYFRFKNCSHSCWIITEKTSQILPISSSQT